MLFAIILIVMIAAIVFFHFLQGFFSATLSAIFAIIAAVFAVSYHEMIVEKFLGGRMADEAHALVLLGMFMVIYLGLRTIFDSLVPGNLQLPVGLDKAGAVVMGLVAAIFATGVVAIAAQELPLAPDIAGYTRYRVEDTHPVVIPLPQNLNGTVWDELSTSTPGQLGDKGETGAGLPIISVDDIVIKTVQALGSTDGALDNGNPIQQFHPNFLDELFAQRLGTETGTSRVAMNIPDKHLEAVKVLGLYDLKNNIEQADAWFTKPRKAKLQMPIKPDRGQMFLVVRVMFSREAADKDQLVRFSPATARLVVPPARAVTEDQPWQDVYPIGTLDNDDNKLFLDKADDFLFVSTKEADHGADLVYLVDAKQFEKQAPSGAFIEVKRLGRVALGGMKVQPRIAPNKDVSVMRPETIGAPPESDQNAQATEGRGQPQPQPEQPQPGQPSAAFQVTASGVSTTLPTAIKNPGGAPTGELVRVPGGSVAFDGNAIKNADLDSTKADQAGGTANQIFVPQGQKAIEITGTPAASAPWGPVAETEQYEVVDSTGKHLQPYGVFVLYNSGADKILFRYTSDTSISGKAPPDANGKPSQVVLIYLVPDGTTISEFDDHGQKAHDENLSAK